VDQHVFEHEGPWTEDAYLALDHGRGRVELVDGTLLFGPGPTPDRDRTVERVRAALGDGLPDGLRVVGPAPLRLGPDCVLVPDLLVTRAPAPSAERPAEPGPTVLAADDTLLVVEVVGREHGATHRLFKPQVYARGAIPYLVVVDHDGPAGHADMIIGGRYHEYARAEGGRLVVEEPFRLEIPLGAAVGAAET
jgi:Putative restriction endonuclease